VSVSTKQRNIIMAAFASIPEVYAGFRLISEVLRRACLESEKQHRRGYYGKPGMPATLAAKYFAARWLAEYGSGRAPLPELRRLHSLRTECMLAASYAADFPEFKSWADSLPAEFWELDYAEMMK
jgi:hypothetical protein